MSEVTQEEKEKTVVAEATAEDAAEAETAIAPTPEGVIEGPEVSEAAEPATVVEEAETETEAISEAEEASQEPQEVTAEAEEPAAEAAEAEDEVVATDAEPAEAEVKVVELALEEEPAEAEAEEEEEAPAAEAKPEEEAPAEEEKPEEKPEPKRKPKRKKTPLQELEAGMETTGRVVGIADFGAFVNIGAETDGLVHISELSDDRVKKVSDVVSVGQQVEVWIKDVDVNKERISLSMRPKPKYRLRDLKPGMVVEGQVTGIRDYGVFVDVGSETEGLVHVSEMAEGYVNKPSELVSVGDDIEVRIKKVDRRRRRISLSMKGMEEAAAQPPPEEQESMPTAMEVAMRRALEEGIDETTDAEMDVEDASRDELGDVFNRMLREYREDQEEA